MTTRASFGEIATDSGILPPSSFQTVHGAEHCGGTNLLTAEAGDCGWDVAEESAGVKEPTATATPSVTRAIIASAIGSIPLLTNFDVSMTPYYDCSGEGVLHDK